MQKLPSKLMLEQALPLSLPAKEQVLRHRKTVRAQLRGQDQRLLLIMGPCSIHDTQAALEYAKKLSACAKRYQNELFIVMRVYCQKPRTGLGWRGLMNDPHLDGRADMAYGLTQARKLMQDITALNLPIATEFLNPFLSYAIEDFVTWGAIGARTVESPTHREMASNLVMPIGFKNTTQGDYYAAIQGMMVAREPHPMQSIHPEGWAQHIVSKGNEDTHLILRGSHQNSNFDAAHLEASTQALQAQGLYQRILVDCSHGNAGSDYQQQVSVCHEVLKHPHPNLLGLMFESFLVGGKQSPNQAKLTYGQSITDPCLSWPETEDLLNWIAHKWATRAPVPEAPASLVSNL